MARGRTQSQKEFKETTAISVSSDPICLRHCVFDGPFLPLNHEGMCVYVVHVCDMLSLRRPLYPRDQVPCSLFFCSFYVRIVDAHGRW
jgi:hypothetical protein